MDEKGVTVLHLLMVNGLGRYILALQSRYRDVTCNRFASPLYLFDH